MTLITIYILCSTLLTYLGFKKINKLDKLQRINFNLVFCFSIFVNFLSLKTIIEIANIFDNLPSNHNLTIFDTFSPLIILITTFLFPLFYFLNINKVNK